MKPIQMLLLQNQKIFSQFFCALPETISDFKYFEKKNDPGRLFVSEIIDCKMRGYLNEEKALCQNTYGQ